MSDLGSVRLKLARARKHQQAVNHHVRRFLETPPYTVRDEIDPKTGEQHWCVNGEPRVPDDSISVLAGDCLYDFRCTLDHLAYQLGVLSGMKRPDRIMFPLFDSADNFLINGFWRVNELRPEIIARIVMSQPCYGWNSHFNLALCALESLSNIDKHRHLNVLAASLGGMMWHPGSPVNGGRGFIYEGPVENGTVVASFPPEEVKVQFSVIYSIAFGESRPMPGGGDVSRVLLSIDSAVWHVLEDFRTRFFPGEPPFIKWDVRPAR